MLGRPLYNMFNQVPKRYDLINRLFTLRLDQHWRALAARLCLQAPTDRVLDLCSGTGDFAITLARLAGSQTSITAVDFSPEMLTLAKHKAKKSGLAEHLTIQQADAAALPFSDGYFDVVGISFAFRNLTYKNPLRNKYLPEILRVIKPGGKCVIVESSQPRSRLLRMLYHAYLKIIVTNLGRLSANPGAYRYLAESASRYYTAEELRKLLLKTGFRTIDHIPLLGGIAAIHVAVKP